MAKLAREGRLRERKLEKQARKVARKQAAAEGPQPPDDHPLGDLTDGEPTPDDG